MEKRYSLFNAYVWGIAGLGLILLATHIPKFQDGYCLLDVLFIGVMVACGEAVAVPLPRGKGTASMATPLMFTAIVLYGPAIGMWMAALATLRKRDLSGEVPLGVVLFNRGMLTLCAYVFAKVYQFVYGEFGSIEFPRGLFAFILAASAFTLLNAILIGKGLAFQLRTSFASIWRRNIAWMLPNMFALFPVGALMVLVVQQTSPLVLVFFYLPLLVTRVSLQKYIDLWDTYSEMAAALSIALDARDSYTHGHSVRVSKYSYKLAKRLGLSDDEAELIKYVGLLHDVGKVGMSDSLLKKEGQFTYDEYEMMKKHSEIGADIIKVMKFLGKGEQWVRHHHERWDGTGFPAGLKGEEIPLGARIIACADAFDAMTTDRPYKEKMSFEEAKRELLECSGTQFDPKVVEAMIQIIDEELLRK
ncbi:MAG TPA: HD-GYP domain-containing protein [Bacillota bacterium]|nr:HD-GYP domain-containing protein [Bacillota bacterium]